MARAGMRLGAFAAAVTLSMLSGCYVGFRGGPAFHSSPVMAQRPETGFEYDVTVGVETSWNDFGVFNPLKGKTRVAMGAGGMESGTVVDSSSPAPTPAPAVVERDHRSHGGAPTGGTGVRGPSAFHAVEAFGDLEVGQTVLSTVWGHKGDEPESGAIVRVTGTLGDGAGDLEIRTGDGRELATSNAHMLNVSGGVEAGVHTGTDIDSIGIFAGAGLRYTSIDADGIGHASSLSPYVSVTVEGGAVFQFFLYMMEAAGGGGRGCH